MLELLCPRCSTALRIAGAQAAAGRTSCPECGLALEFRVADPGEPAGARAPRARAAAPQADTVDLGAELAGDATRSGYGTDFHPKSLFDEATRRGPGGAPDARAQRSPLDGDSTASLPADAAEIGWEDATGARRPPARAAFLLRIGGRPGSERLAIPWARTVVGRREADLRLADAAVSARHFQIESIGAEFFVRDLGSRNGTWLNGHRVRYAELRPGDALRAGGTELVFRTADDGIARGEGPA